MIHLCLLLASFLSYTIGDELVLLNAIHRHGERTPTVFYPNDPHSHDYWPRGLGQLTNKGKQQEFQLGQFLRKSYGDFIGDRYFANLTYYRSTDIDRTLMSAQLVCAGLFRPHQDDVWNADLMWQPVPIHTVLTANDYLLARSSDCPKYFQLLEQARKVPPISTVIEKYRPLFNSLSEHLNFTVNFTNIWEVYDDVSKELAMNMTEPHWLENIWSEIVSINDEEYGLMVPSRELQRLKAGPFVKELVEHCRMKIEGTITQKLFLYSAHDTTLAIMMDALSIFNGHQPSYAAAIIIELHDLGAGGTDYANYAIKFLFRNLTREEPYPLTVPGCGSTLCRFDRFIDVVQDLFPDDIVNECGRNEVLISSLSIHFLTIVVCCSLMFLLVICLTLCIVVKYMRKSSAGFRPLINGDIEK